MHTLAHDAAYIDVAACEAAPRPATMPFARVGDSRVAIGEDHPESWRALIAWHILPCWLWPEWERRQWQLIYSQQSECELRSMRRLWRRVHWRW